MFLSALVHKIQHTTSIMADQFLGFDLSTQQLKGEGPHSSTSYPTIQLFASS